MLSTHSQDLLWLTLKEVYFLNRQVTDDSQVTDGPRFALVVQCHQRPKSQCLYFVIHSCPELLSKSQHGFSNFKQHIITQQYSKKEE